SHSSAPTPSSPSFPTRRSSDLQPLPHLRPAASVPAQVRNVPYLLPHSCRRGPHPRRDEVELVMMMATAATPTTKMPAKPVRTAHTGIVSDPIADMLTRIRNASGARHPEVSVPAS